MAQRIPQVIAVLAIVIVAAIPAAAQDGMNPFIPGGNSAPPGEAPKAVVDKPLYDFGTALEGDMVRHTFTIKNAGKGYLDIRGVKTSCGCTAAAPTKTHLAPGESTEVPVGFDTRFEHGHQTRDIWATTNDPANPQVTMTLQGVIKPQLAATPQEVDFGKVPKGTAKEQTVTIDDLIGGNKFDVTDVSNSDRSIKVTLEKRHDGKSGAILNVKLLPTKQVGPIKDAIKITNNRSPLMIDVDGVVLGNLVIDPPQASFDVVPVGQDSVRFVRLTNSNSKRAVNITDVTSSSPTVTASVEPVTPGTEYKITITLKRGTPEGMQHGVITIKTDDPDQKTITIPYYAIVGQLKA
ncbi:MAG TPA: DUF1573 domain-containing protein [Candidatus Binataceae bacterium]|nr:DUF1573 domain-containing protein [Candidatus Binataceae bacterium]